MNALLLPEVQNGSLPIDQRSLLLAGEGSQRTVWRSDFRPILLGARDVVAFFSGLRVMAMVEPLECEAATGVTR